MMLLVQHAFVAAGVAVTVPCGMRCQRAAFRRLCHLPRCAAIVALLL